MDKQKKEIEKENPTLPPNPNVEQNMANGLDEEMPDPDDIPDGTNSNLQPLPDLMQSDAHALEQSTEKTPQK